MFLNCADITSSVFHMHTYQTHAPLMGESGLCVCVEGLWEAGGRMELLLACLAAMCPVSVAQC